jgi:hypothetical protein
MSIIIVGPHGGALLGSGLARPLVTVVGSLALNYYDCSNRGCIGWHIVLVFLLSPLTRGVRGAVVHLLANACVPGLPFDSPGALDDKVEELEDVLDVVSSELLQHLLVLYSLSECGNDRRKGNAGDGVPYLGKALDEEAQHLSWALLYGVEVDLHLGP